MNIKILIAALIYVVASSSAQDATGENHGDDDSATELAALNAVARRTAAYNAHDIDAFLATYDEKVRVYEYPDNLLGEGRDRMRRIFGPQFAENDGSIVVHSQHALENTVLSDETVTFYGNTEHNIGIYTIKDRLIVEVRLIEPAD